VSIPFQLTEVATQSLLILPSLKSGWANNTVGGGAAFPFYGTVPLTQKGQVPGPMLGEHWLLDTVQFDFWIQSNGNASGGFPPAPNAYSCTAALRGSFGALWQPLALTDWKYSTYQAWHRFQQILNLGQPVPIDPSSLSLKIVLGVALPLPLYPNGSAEDGSVFSPLLVPDPLFAGQLPYPSDSTNGVIVSGAIT